MLTQSALYLQNGKVSPSCQPLDTVDIEKKTRFFLRRNFTPFMSKSCQIWDHFFSLLFPKGFKNLKKFWHWTLGSGGRKTFKRSDQMQKKSIKKTFFAATILHPLLAQVFKSEGQKIRDFSSPQCQPNQTYCTAGESLLTWCAGLCNNNTDRTGD